ncbi:hypothetical protein [Methanomethylophilus alvi]|uniref:hypothetical protein n=1 Tax=Methanomethylophilus alvi TaxID=1291540 RepID=UPI0037DCF153
MCPFCGKEVPFDSWGEAMNVAERKGFSDLGMTMPCCGRKGSLDRLDYRRPCAIAMFKIELRNVPGDVTEDMLKEAGRILGTGLKTVEARY